MYKKYNIELCKEYKKGLHKNYKRDSDFNNIRKPAIGSRNC